MDSDQQLESLDTEAADVVDFSAAILETVQTILYDRDEAERDISHLLSRVKDLVTRRQKGEATKGETRDLIAEALFSRLSKAFGTFLESDGLDGDPRKISEMVLGTMLTGAALADFAMVFDRAVLEQVSPREYHLAGRADFIALDELLQLLASGKHTGHLILEKPDSQLDLYLENGVVAFLDPHWLSQRLFRDEGEMSGFREFPIEIVEEANGLRTTEGKAIFLTLLERGLFEEDRFLSDYRAIECELLYQFLMDVKDCRFTYRSIEELPAFANDYFAGMPIMPLLLESSRRIDDWRRLRRVFPDLDEPLEPAPDLFAKIGNMNLSVIEIKVLTLVNSRSSFRSIMETVGIGDFDLGTMLVGFANEGILEPPGGAESLFDDLMGLADTIERATEVLDGEERVELAPDALDAVFGGEEEGGFGLGQLKAARGEESQGD